MSKGEFYPIEVYGIKQYLFPYIMFRCYLVTWLMNG